LLLSDDLAERFEAVLREENPAFDERRRFLEDCVARLPEKSRRALDMKYGQGTSTEALAKSLSSSVNAARILLCRARRAVGECMERSLRLMRAGGDSA
jgi:DNA-directed RNA polymerase specialized sigma24 family protein